MTSSGLNRAGRILVYVLLVLGVVLALAPFAVTTLASFKSTIELVQGPFQPPAVWQWQNYVTAWTDGNLDRFFLNSLVVAVAVVVPSVFLSAMTGYAFA